jgi:hypothetical protein
MPDRALNLLLDQLREDPVLAPHLVESREAPALGALAASGPRTSAAAAEYALVVEAIREGYLLHYGLPRLLRGQDRDLSLLAGDYLYALGLARLSALDDLPAVRALSDLISRCAQVHGEGSDGELTERMAGALWLATVVAIARGSAEADLDRQVADVLPGGDPASLLASALDSANQAGLGDHIATAAESIGFQPISDLP